MIKLSDNLKPLEPFPVLSVEDRALERELFTGPAKRCNTECCCASCCSEILRIQCAEYFSYIHNYRDVLKQRLAPKYREIAIYELALTKRLLAESLPKFRIYRSLARGA